MKDRAWLEAQAARYLHRTDFTASDYDLAIGDATALIGEHLRSSVVELVSTIASASVTNPEPIPDRLRAIRRLTRIQSGQRRELVPGMDYYTEADQIYFITTTTGDLEIDGWYRPVDLVAATDTNNVLEGYPDLYLLRVLAGLCSMAQDYDAAGMWLAQWQGEIDRMNIADQVGRFGSAPAMRRG